MSSKDALGTNHPVLLSDATLSALQINQQPFEALAPDAELFTDETTAEQLADLKQALITGDDLLLVLGAAGSGKSVLLQQLGQNSGLRIQCFAVKGSPRFSTLNLFAGMLEAFKRPPPEKLKEILDDLIPCLQTMVSRNTLSAIVLDDAHRVTETELTQLLSGMLYLNSQDETLLRVTLAAPEEFEDRIPDLLPEGADLPYSSLTIEGMNPVRATDYLSYRLALAGFVDDWPFSDDDIKDLVVQSGGLPGPLHAEAAAYLNRQYGPEDQNLPAELISDERESLMQSRVGKLALGALAAVLIVGGLSMFMPDKSNPNATRVSDTVTAADTLGNNDTTLRLVETETVAVTPIDLRGADQTSADQTVETDEPVTEPVPAETIMTASDLDPQGTATANTGVSAEVDDAQADIDEVADSGPRGTTDIDTADAPAAQAADPIVIVADGQNPAAALPVPTDTSPPPEVQTSELAVDATDTPPEGDNDNRSTPDEAAIDQSLADVDPALVGMLESPTWILVQDDALFTVQMSASRDRESVENFLKRNAAALSEPNSIYTFTRDGDTWYALLNGLYPSINAAREAVESMPSSALTNQPWIRSVGRVQDVLRAQ